MFDFLRKKEAGSDIKALIKRVNELTNEVEIYKNDLEFLRKRYETYLNSDKVDRAAAGRVERKALNDGLEEFITDLVTDPDKKNMTITDLLKNPSVMAYLGKFLLKR